MPTAERRICVSICERDTRTVATAIKDAAEIGYSIEVRLDCINKRDLPSAIERLPQLLQEHARSAIITFRPEEQGGLCPLRLVDRLQFWRAHGFGLPACLFDLEIDLVEEFLRTGEPIDWSRVICSTHDFSTDVDVTSLYERI